MRKTKIKPEISGPGLPKWVIYAASVAGGFVILTGLIVAFAKWESRSVDTAVSFVFQEGIPDGFFVRRSTEEPEQFELPETSLPPPPERAPPPAPAVTPKQPIVRPRQAPPAARPKAPEPVVVHGPLFKPVEEPREDPAVVRQRERFNAMRRRAGGEVRVSRKGVREEYRYDATDKSWKRYGIEQEDASFPRDMARLITQDRIFRAVLVNDISSDLPGQVVAQIEQPVYGAHGRNILIPAGSRAIGNYEPLSRIGEERLSIFWTRIITPDGINITLEDGQAVDQMGRSGLSGKLDRRYGERYGISMLFSIVSTAMQLSVPTDTANPIVINNLVRETSELSSMILEDHLDIKPRLQIPAGTRIHIQPSRDIYFQEPVRRTVRVTDAAKVGEDRG